jgi:predicted nucleic acid-binding protein
VTLIDTSVWIGHLDRGDDRIVELLTRHSAGIHAFVIGELAAGTLKNRAKVLSYFSLLPQAPVARESEVHHILETHRLWGTGLGWVDLHLLASTVLAGWKLLTADRALQGAARKLGIAAPA